MRFKCPTSVWSQLRFSIQMPHWRTFVEGLKHHYWRVFTVETSTAQKSPSLGSKFQILFMSGISLPSAALKMLPRMVRDDQIVQEAYTLNYTTRWSCRLSKIFHFWPNGYAFSPRGLNMQRRPNPFNFKRQMYHPN